MNVDKFRAKSKDPAWKYAFWPKEYDKNCVQCELCNKKYNGGIYRIKQHLLGGSGNVKLCQNVTHEIRQEISSYMESRKRGQHEIIDDESTEHANDESKKICIEPKLGLELQNHEDDPALASRIQERKIEGREEVVRKIARWMYQAGISFDATKLKSFAIAVDAIGQFGPSLELPSYHELRGPLLKSEVNSTLELLKKYKIAWRKYGCTIMVDEHKNTNIINFFINSPEGTYFIRSVDTSHAIRVDVLLFQELDKVIEEIGKENVVQVVLADSRYLKAGKMLLNDQPQICLTPCVAFDTILMLEDILKQTQAELLISKGRGITSFIYRHKFLLSSVRKKMAGMELVRSGISRCTTHYLNLESLYAHRDILRELFISDEWKEMSFSRSTLGSIITQSIASSYWWESVGFCLKVTRPIVEILRLVISDEKPPLGFIYVALEDAKEKLKIQFNNVKNVYREVLADVDKKLKIQLDQPLHLAAFFLNPYSYFRKKETSENSVGKFEVGFITCIEKMVGDTTIQDNIFYQIESYKNSKELFGRDSAIRLRSKMLPHKWWETFGTQTPELKSIALRILGLSCSASVYARYLGASTKNQSTKQNRFEQRRVEDLLYVQHNQNLRERFLVRQANQNIFDPIALDAIDTNSEWLTRIDSNEKSLNDGKFSWSEMNSIDEAEHMCPPVRFCEKPSLVVDPHCDVSDDDETQPPDFICEIDDMSQATNYLDDSEFLDPNDTSEYEVLDEDSGSQNKMNGNVLAGGTFLHKSLQLE